MENIAITPSCGNVFADLGLPNAEERLAKADEEIKSNGLTQFTEFQALTERKAAIDAELKGIKARLADLEPRLLEFMTEMGMQSIKAGGRTFYIHRQLWAGKLADADPHQFAEIMRALGLGDMVKESVNAQTLSSWVREQAAELDGAATPEEIVAALPEELRGIVKISEVYSVRSRKS